MGTMNSSAPDLTVAAVHADARSGRQRQISLTLCLMPDRDGLFDWDQEFDQNGGLQKVIGDGPRCRSVEESIRQMLQDRMPHGCRAVSVALHHEHRIAAQLLQHVVRELDSRISVLVPVGTSRSSAGG